MRLSILVLALLCLLPVAHAVSLSEFLKPYLLPGESFKSETFQLSNRSFILVKIFGQPHLLVEAKAEEFELISDEPAIYGILWERALSRIDIEATKNSSSALIIKFNSTRQVNEDECRRLTGTDRFPCVDKDSCIVACRSVPSCGTALSYDINAIRALQNWLDTTTLLDLQLPIVLAAHASVGDNYEASYIDNALAEENYLRGLSLNISTNPIFHCGVGGACYCPRPNFNLTYLDSSKKLLTALRDEILGLPLIQNTSEYMAIKTAERSGLKDEGARYGLVLQESETRISNVRNAVTASLLFVNDPVLKTHFNEAQSIYLSLRNSIERKEFSGAGTYANLFNQKLEVISARIDENEKAYAQIVELKENATGLLDSLDSLPLDNSLIEEVDSLRSQLDSIDLRPPLKKELMPGLRTELSGIVARANEIHVSVEGQRLAGLLSRTTARFNNLTVLDKAYAQGTNFTNISSAMLVADVLLQADDVQGAEVMLKQANAQMDALFPQLMKLGREIDAAKAEISSAELAIRRASDTHFILVQPDTAAATAKLQNATAMLYKDPSNATALAQEAEGMANDAVSGAAAKDQLFLIFGVVVGLAAIVGILYWLYRREEE
ncbi:MAG: hypothetical protein Q7T16_01035 [Candidatus Burarchaeum sp.]|nr:hypothetical protein [Candidatus Burarchaeum sp.]MDO8339220.1 hypothetical protein [Candidatus Burarchaeum sp.]